MIFVFGSNESGKHGAGAAYYAYKNHQAQMGVSFGFTGNAFAIPTKDVSVYKSLPLNVVKMYVDLFINMATRYSDVDYKITQIGCGLAGFVPDQMAPLFEHAPDTCWFDTAWKLWLPHKKFWGTK